MRVLIADDHRLIVEGVKRALEDSPDFEVVGECSSGSQVLPMVGRTNPDIVLLDLRMPGADGLSSLTRIRKQYPDVKVVILSVSTDENVIQTVLKRGASAYIVKSINPIDLPSALRQAVEGTVYSAIGLPDSGDSAARAAGLTERETAILSALARGLSNEAIGKELWVAEQTVKFHLTNIYRKLGVSNRTEAARLAYQNGLVESPIDDGGVGTARLPHPRLLRAHPVTGGVKMPVIPTLGFLQDFVLTGVKVTIPAFFGFSWRLIRPFLFDFLVRILIFGPLIRTLTPFTALLFAVSFSFRWLLRPTKSCFGWTTTFVQ
jgi:DNA-binding NarL/FixJ family response regulator